MLLAKLNGNQIEKYPYSLAELRRSHPRTSFPRDLSAADLNKYGVVVVEETPRPERDITKNISQGQPQEVGGKWVQTWTVTDATPEEIEARRPKPKLIDRLIQRLADKGLLTEADAQELQQ